ncbi:MAG: hypothetical protein VXZ96_01760 [Myxococcota bacterium]|nr:hypothetical protein [Myxococcota bacterium]
MSSLMTATDLLSTKVQHTHSHHQILKRGLPPVLAVATLSTLSLVPFLGIVTVPALMIALPLMVFGHAILLRAHLIDPALEYCDGSRYFVTRWSLRLLYWTTAIWGYVLSALTPFWSIVIVPTVFSGLTFISYKYTHWQLERASIKAPIHMVEQFLLALLVLGFMGSIGLSVFLLTIFGGMTALISIFAQMV